MSFARDVLTDPTTAPDLLWAAASDEALDVSLRIDALRNPNFPLARLAAQWREGGVQRPLLDRAFVVRAMLENVAFPLFAVMDEATARAVVDQHVTTTLLEALEMVLPQLVVVEGPLGPTFETTLARCLERHGFEQAHGIAAALLKTYRVWVTSAQADLFDLRFGVASFLSGVDERLRHTPKVQVERNELFVEVFTLLLVEMGLPADQHPSVALLPPPW